jgi:hypothetical protein
MNFPAYFSLQVLDGSVNLVVIDRKDYFFHNIGALRHVEREGAVIERRSVVRGFEYSSQISPLSLSLSLSNFRFPLILFTFVSLSFSHGYRGAAVEGFESCLCIPYDRFLKSGSVVKVI